MKITFVSPALNLGGGTRVLAIYANELARRGHAVTVVAPARKEPETVKRLVKGFVNPDKKRKHEARRRIPPYFDDTAATVRVLDHGGPVTAADLPDADVVVATWWETAFMVVHLPPSKGRKFYFVQHHEVHDHLPHHLSGGSYFLPLKKITIASWLVDVMRDVYGDDDVALVPNSVDLDLFHAPERGRQRRPTVGLLYSALHYKGVDLSLRAIEIARRIHPDLQVVAFGSKPQTRDLVLPEGSTFHLVPSQDQLRRIYGGCDAWLFGSRVEGFGLPILEALACRTPVVATRAGAAPDWIEDGRNGFVVDVEDAEALGARLTELLSLDEPAWRAMSDAALASVQRYTWQDAATLFEQVIGATEPSRRSQAI